MLPAALLEAVDLVAALLLKHFALNASIGDHRRANGDVGASAYHQHVIELNLVACRGSEALDGDLVVFGDAILLAARLDDRVHPRISVTDLRALRRRPASGARLCAGLLLHASNCAVARTGLPKLDGTSQTSGPKRKRRRT